jgi:hypothetical protein
VWGHDEVVAVAGPAAADGDHPASVSADDDLSVDAASVVLTDGGDRLIVHRDQGAVDDPRVVAIVWCGLQNIGQYRHQVMDDPIDGGLTRVEQGGQCPGGQVGAHMDQHQQHPGWQRQTPGPSRVWLHVVAGLGADDVYRAGGEPGERHQVSISVRGPVDVGRCWFHDRYGSRVHRHHHHHRYRW